MDNESGVVAFTDDSVPTRVVGAVQAEVDGELILLSPKDFSYFGAAGTGGPVWDLVDGTRSVGQIVAQLEEQYTADPGVIRAETVEFLDALRAAGLLEFVG
ncbi:MAG: PqqD family protein [Actinomycetota bacterium]|nr:PqqD family protein [Actinomycetota bacterium]